MLKPSEGGSDPVKYGENVLENNGIFRSKIMNYQPIPNRKTLSDNIAAFEKKTQDIVEDLKSKGAYSRALEVLLHSKATVAFAKKIASL